MNTMDVLRSDQGIALRSSDGSEASLFEATAADLQRKVNVYRVATKPVSAGEQRSVRAITALDLVDYVVQGNEVSLQEDGKQLRINLGELPTSKRQAPEEIPSVLYMVKVDDIPPQKTKPESTVHRCCS